MRTPIRHSRTPLSSVTGLALLVAGGLMAAPAPAHDAEPVPLSVSAEAQSKYDKLHKALSASAAKKVTGLAKQSAPKIIEADASAFENSAKQGVSTTWSVLGSMNDADIMAMAFLVMMEAARSAQEDLKSIMANVKAINDAEAKARALRDQIQKEMAKQGVSDCKSIKQSPKAVASKTPWLGVELLKIPALPAVGGVPKAQLPKACGEITASVKELSDISEEQQLKMQMVMERMTKGEQAVSNLAKKVSDTASSIIQNLK